MKPLGQEFLIDAVLWLDADAIGRLLHAFNREFDEPAPEPSVLAARMRQLLDGGGTLVLLAGDGPDGLAVLRFRPAIWSAGLECYLAELYVTPARRGQGVVDRPVGQALCG